MNKETHNIPDYEVRSTGEAPTIEGNKIFGYAAIYNSLSNDLGGFKEVIRPGAFKRHLENNPDVRALIEHNPQLLLGRTTAGTLRLSEDSRGLRYEVDLPDTSYANDLRALMKRGDVSKSSFGFRVSKEGQRWRNEGTNVIRELHDVEVFDVSTLTSVPAYNATSVALRSLESFNEEQEKAAKEQADKQEAERLAKEQADEAARLADENQKRMWLKQWEIESSI